MTTPARDSNLHLLLTSACRADGERDQGSEAVERSFELLDVTASTLRPASISVTRLELAQALNMLLFDKLLQEVPAGRDYVADAAAAGIKIRFDHGAVRTVLRGGASNFPDGEALFTRMLLPLGYQLAGLYPLPRINMTGHVYAHLDDPENIAQFFVSELHPEKFSASFQTTVEALLANSRDPLSADQLGLLDQLAAHRRAAPVAGDAGMFCAPSRLADAAAIRGFARRISRNGLDLHRRQCLQPCHRPRRRRQCHRGAPAPAGSPD